MGKGPADKMLERRIGQAGNMVESASPAGLGVLSALPMRGLGMTGHAGNRTWQSGKPQGHKFGGRKPLADLGVASGQLDAQRVQEGKPALAVCPLIRRDGDRQVKITEKLITHDTPRKQKRRGFRHASDIRKPDYF